MEPTDENRTMPKDSEAIGMEAQNTDATKPPKNSWRKRITGMIQKALLAGDHAVRGGRRQR